MVWTVLQDEGQWKGGGTQLEGISGIKQMEDAQTWFA